jgi:hypothetical protein
MLVVLEKSIFMPIAVVRRIANSTSAHLAGMAATSRYAPLMEGWFNGEITV